MPRRALIEHRPFLLVSIATAIAYYVLSNEEIPGLYLALLKALPVAMLALYAQRRASGHDASLIALALAFGAAGDLVLEFDLVIGGLTFVAGHAVAISLYLRNRRQSLKASQSAAGIALIALTPIITALIAFPRENWWLATAYALVLGAMAAAAWRSRFPRYRVGLGAVLFVISDLLIFAREADRLPAEITEWLIWPIYSAAQFLIATGVVPTLRRDAGKS